MNKNLPNFLCVGAQKAATTTISKMLQQHPQVFVPQQKELHYFDASNYQYKNSKKYSDAFQDSDKYKIKAEFTPEYLYFEEVPERIFELLGSDVKILIILRHPIERAFSHYTMVRHGGHEKLSFEDSFLQEKERIRIDPVGRNKHSQFDRGLYSNQVRRYLDLFSNVKVILFEDFIQNNTTTMEEIYLFLGIDSVYIPLSMDNVARSPRSLKFQVFLSKVRRVAKKLSYLKYSKTLREIKRKLQNLNEKPDKIKMQLSKEFQTMLHDYYYQDICSLEKLIDRDLSHWKNKYI